MERDLHACRDAKEAFRGLPFFYAMYGRRCLSVSKRKRI
jgi:hypothetical protein